MITLEEKYTLMKKAIEYLKSKNGKSLMVNIIGSIGYIVGGKAKWDEIKEIIFELEKHGIVEIKPLWFGEYEVILKKK